MPGLVCWTWESDHGRLAIYAAIFLVVYIGSAVYRLFVLHHEGIGPQDLMERLSINRYGEYTDDQIERNEDMAYQRGEHPPAKVPIVGSGIIAQLAFHIGVPVVQGFNQATQMLTNTKMMQALHQHLSDTRKERALYMHLNKLLGLTSDQLDLDELDQLALDELVAEHHELMAKAEEEQAQWDEFSRQTEELVKSQAELDLKNAKIEDHRRDHPEETEQLEQLEAKQAELKRTVVATLVESHASPAWKNYLKAKDDMDEAINRYNWMFSRRSRPMQLLRFKRDEKNEIERDEVGNHLYEEVKTSYQAAERRRAGPSTKHSGPFDFVKFGREDPQFIERHGWLIQKYKRDAYYAEFVLLVHRLCLVIVSVIFESEDATGRRTVVQVVATVLVLVWTAWEKPFRGQGAEITQDTFSQGDFLEMLALFCLVGGLIVGYVCSLSDEDERSGGFELLVEVLMSLVALAPALFGVWTVWPYAGGPQEIRREHQDRGHWQSMCTAAKCLTAAQDAIKRDDVYAAEAALFEAERAYKNAENFRNNGHSDSHKTDDQKVQAEKEAVGQDLGREIGHVYANQPITPGTRVRVLKRKLTEVQKYVGDTTEYELMTSTVAKIRNFGKYKAIKSDTSTTESQLDEKAHEEKLAEFYGLTKAKESAATDTRKAEIALLEARGILQRLNDAVDRQTSEEGKGQASGTLKAKAHQSYRNVYKGVTEAAHQATEMAVDAGKAVGEAAQKAEERLKTVDETAETDDGEDETHERRLVGFGRGLAHKVGDSMTNLTHHEGEEAGRGISASKSLRHVVVDEDPRDLLEAAEKIEREAVKEVKKFKRVEAKLGTEHIDKLSKQLYQTGVVVGSIGTRGIRDLGHKLKYIVQFYDAESPTVPIDPTDSTSTAEIEGTASGKQVAVRLRGLRLGDAELDKETGEISKHAIHPEKGNIIHFEYEQGMGHDWFLPPPPYNLDHRIKAERKKCEKLGTKSGRGKVLGALFQLEKKIVHSVENIEDAAAKHLLQHIDFKLTGDQAEGKQDDDAAMATIVDEAIEKHKEDAKYHATNWKKAAREKKEKKAKTDQSSFEDAATESTGKKIQMKAKGLFEDETSPETKQKSGRKDGKGGKGSKGGKKNSQNDDRNAFDNPLSDDP
eukprot:COSAG06_NODE_286_length_18312_cov_90.377752_9_plen_1135_part_00